MDFELRILSAVLQWLSRLPPAEQLAGLCALAIIALLYRRNRYLTEGWRRERERRLTERRAHSMRLNATVKSLIELWSHAPAPRLRDLANNIEEDFTLKS